VSRVLSHTLLGFVQGVDQRVWPIYGPDPDDFHELMTKSREVALLASACEATPVALTEPFKVRVITRGCAHHYQVARRWQRRISPLLGGHPTMSLTRGPITQNHLDWFTARLSHRFTQGETFLVSGDYEAATDHLDPEYSTYALGVLLDRLGVPLDDQIILRRALVGHQLHCGEEVKKQEWGQLMGSPISFPILCILNVAVTRLAMDCDDRGIGLDDLCSQPYRPSRQLRDYPLLVNGDDVGFESSPAGYELWKLLTAAVGLKFSLGKNYTSRDFLILNSALHQMHHEADYFGQARPRLENIPFLQCRLLWGTERSVSTRSQDASSEREALYRDAFSTGAMAQDLCSDFPDRKEWIVSRIIRRQRTRLQGVPSGMSWFLPRQLGGVGLPCTRPDQISPKQLKTAAYIATRQPGDMVVLSWAMPELPGFLESYLKAIRAQAGPRILIPVERMKDGQTFRHLTNFAAAHYWQADGVVADVQRQEGAFRKLWKAAQSTSLQPMSLNKALTWQQPFGIAVPRWV